MRTRDDAFGACSGVGAGGGAFTSMVELLSGTQRCQKAPPCRRICTVRRSELEGTCRLLGHFAKWYRKQETIPAKSASTQLCNGATNTLATGVKCRRGRSRQKVN